eukprot:g12613.t1
MIREPPPFPVTSIEFLREEWNAPTIQRRFREEVDRFSPDFVIITDSWNFKPLLAEAMQGYRYLLRLAAQECLCPLNNIRLLIDADGRPSACPKNQLATADACRQCVADNDHYSGSLHRAERELAGFSDANYEESLRRAFSRAEAVLVVNPLIAATISAYTKDVRVIPSGFDPDRFPPPFVELPDEIQIDEKRSDGESATPTVILFAGLCDEYIKGFHVLREALSIVWERRQDFELRVTSDPPPTPLPFARYVGWQSQDNLPALMRSADMVVFPTVVEEALGRTAVEAMGAGKPVVASRIGGLPFTVLDEATGLLFEPGNAADLAAKIERLLNDAELRTRLGAAGRRRFETSYSWPVIAMSRPRVALIYDDRPRPETTGGYCRRGLAELADVEHFLPEALSTKSANDFDLYLRVDDGIDYVVPASCRPLALWAIDTHINYGRMRDAALQADAVFAAQQDGAARLCAEGIDAEWLPLACDPAIHRPHDVPQIHDVVFVGNRFPGPRAELLDRIAATYPRHFIGHAYFDDMAKTYAAGRIAFNRSLQRDINMRVFEALACGVLLITNDLADNGQSELFTDGVHLATYDDGDDLIDKIGWYLRHDVERAAIAARGLDEVRRHHTYRHRMQRILETMTAFRSGSSRTRSVLTTPAKPAGYFEFDRPDVLALVPESARDVLDIGCGGGRLGGSIKSRQSARVTGVEYEAEVAAAAGTRLDAVVCGDVEDSDEIQFPESQFDCVVCADVLEHLTEPEAVLQRSARWLKPDGRLVVSLPNVRNASVVSSLLAGNWTYETAGLLDTTHRRFFTRRDMDTLLTENGFEIETMHVTPGPGYQEWEQQGRPGDVRVGRLALSGLSSQEAEEFFVYQYLFRARRQTNPASSPVPADLPLLPVPSPEWESRWHERMRDAWLSQKLDRPRRLREHLDYVNRHVPCLGQTAPGVVFDLGPGAGELLEIARWMGHTAHGIDAESGTGGMGDEYLEACRLIWERQQLSVSLCGGARFFDEPQPATAIGQTVLINSRGSLEQSFSQHLIGPPHDAHHDARRMSWRIDADLREAFNKMFQCAARLLRPEGLLLIHANGARNGAQADELLRRRPRVAWIPHAASELFLHASRPWNARDINCLLVGNLDAAVYPLRARLARLIASGAISGTVRPHPGYRLETLQACEAQEQDYANALGRAKIVLVDSSLYNYGLAKYPEAALAGACLAGDAPPDFDESLNRCLLTLAPEDSDAQLVDTIRRALADDKSLCRQAAIGQQAAAADHGMPLYAERLLAAIRGLLDARKENPTSIIDVGKEFQNELSTAVAHHRKRFESTCAAVAYRESGILPSEMLLLLSLCAQQQVGTVIESGRKQGYSTEVLVQSGMQIISIEQSPDRETDARLQSACPGIELLTGDACRRLPELLRQRAATERVAVLLDGPKGERALRLIEPLLPDVAFVALHDASRHRLGHSGQTEANPIRRILEESSHDVGFSDTLSEVLPESLDEPAWTPHAADRREFTQHGFTLAIIRGGRWRSQNARRASTTVAEDAASAQPVSVPLRPRRVRMRIVYDVEGWAFYRRAVSLQKYAPEDFEVSIGPDVGEGSWDLVFLMSAPDATRIRSLLPPDTRLITGINNSLKKPLLRHAFAGALQHSDLVLFNNPGNWRDAGCPPGTACLSNGYDADVFQVTTPVNARPWRVVWCGSQGARTIKGYDDVLVPLADILNRHGIECDWRMVDATDRRTIRAPEEMAAWYNRATHYVCASHFEGTPNPAIESAACGCIVVSTPVGDMPDLIEDGRNGFLMPQRDPEAFAARILESCDRQRFDRMSAEMQRAVSPRAWRNVASQFFDLFRQVVCQEAPDSRGENALARPDASQPAIGRDICVIAVGESPLIDKIPTDSARVTRFDWSKSDCVRTRSRDAEVAQWLDVSASRYDRILVDDLLSWLDDPLAVLRLFKKHLKPGGQLVLGVTNLRHHASLSQLFAGRFPLAGTAAVDRPIRHYTRREVEKLLFRAGFEINAIEAESDTGYRQWVADGRPLEVRCDGLQYDATDTRDAEEFFAKRFVFTAAADANCRAVVPCRPAAPANDRTITRLREQFPWPETRPAMDVSGLPPGWMADGAREALRRVVPRNARLIVELGSWLGLSTRYLAQLAPDATVVAIDHWQGSIEHQRNPRWEPHLDRLDEGFLASCWAFRDRIIPLKMSTQQGLQLLSECGIAPDVIYCDADHHYDSVRADLELCESAFPKAVLAGDDFDEHDVRRAVEESASARGLKVQTHGTNWRGWVMDPHAGACSAPEPDLVSPVPDTVAPFGLTSIVIVTHNQLRHTRACVDSIRHVTDEPVELIFVDNGSTDGTVDYLNSISGATVITNAVNRGFPAGANQGLQVACGDSLLLLNNDTIVTTGWLKRMLIALHSDRNIGFVGPRSNHVSGGQQIAADYTDLSELDGFAWSIGQRNAGRIIPTDRLVGFCLLFRRDVYETIGGLDERFGIGNFEDDDFCHRARNAGYRAIIAADAFVHHVGGATFRASDIDFAALMAENQQKYEQKWSAGRAADSQGSQAAGQSGRTTQFACDHTDPRGLRLKRVSPRLSLCMIVRDNESTIRPALESISPWVDEMIVVHQFPWIDDFSAARNASIDHAIGEWVFWMDSDDTIPEHCGRALRRLADGQHPEHVLGYVLQVHCPAAGDPDDITAVDHVKLFRNQPELRFEHRIHEQIIPAIRRAGGDVAFTDLFVVHSGSDQTPEGRQRKLERDYRILKLDLQERPDHPFVLFNLSMTYADDNRHEEAVQYLTRSITVSNEHESHVGKAYALLVSALSKAGRRDEAWVTCRRGLEIFPDDKELLFRSAMLSHDFGRLEEAVEAYQQVLQESTDRQFSSVDVGISGYKARHNLAIVYGELNEYEAAESQWRRAVEDRPDYRPGWNGLGDTLIQRRRLREADKLGQELMHRPSRELKAAGRILRAKVAAARDDRETAYALLHAAVEASPQDLEVMHELSRLLFEQGDFQRAEPVLQSLAELAPDDPSVRHNLGTVFLQSGRFREAAGAFRESLRLRPDSPETERLLAHAVNQEIAAQQASDPAQVRRLLHSPLIIIADEPVDQMAMDMVNRTNVYLELKCNPVLVTNHPLLCDSGDPLRRISGSRTQKELVTRREIADLGNVRGGLIQQIIDLLRSVPDGYGVFHRMGLVRQPPPEREFKRSEPQTLTAILRPWSQKQVRNQFVALHKSGLITGERETGNAPWQYRLPEALDTATSPFASLPEADELFSGVVALGGVLVGTRVYGQFSRRREIERELLQTTVPMLAEKARHELTTLPVRGQEDMRRYFHGRCLNVHGFVEEICSVAFGEKLAASGNETRQQLLTLAFENRVVAEDSVLSRIDTVAQEAGRIGIPHSELLQTLIAYQEELQESHPEKLSARADAYLTDWCSPEKQWLKRLVMVGQVEPLYQLTPPVEDIFVFLDRVLEKELGFVGTESRLKLVIDTLADLVVGSSDEPHARLEHLRSEELQIQQEIQQIETEGCVSKYQPSQIRERFATAVQLLRQLQADFRAVEESFRKITMQVQQRQVAGRETRGGILEFALDAEDVLKQEDQGVSFYEFVRLILSPTQTERLEQVVKEVRFIPELTGQQDGLETVRGMVALLQAEAAKVMRTNQRLSTTLRRLLDERAHAERKRVAELLRDIRGYAAAIADDPPIDEIGIELQVNLRIESPFRRTFWSEPSRFEQVDLTDFEPDQEERMAAFRGLAAMHRLDWKRMRQRIREMISLQPTATLGDLLREHPPENGVIEVLGYLQIAREDGHLVTAGTHEEIFVPADNDRSRDIVVTVPLVRFTSQRSRADARPRYERWKVLASYADSATNLQVGKSAGFSRPDSRQTNWKRYETSWRQRSNEDETGHRKPPKTDDTRESGERARKEKTMIQRNFPSMEQSFVRGYRLRKLEVFNWGTFDGEIFSVCPDGQTTLLIGHNGTGKSTLVDALLTLLVKPSIRNFNVAAGGKKKERDDKTYVKGAYDRNSRDDGQGIEVKFLRPKGDHYSVLLACFHNQETDCTFTVAQLLYLNSDRSVEKVFCFAEEERSIREDFGELDSTVGLLKTIGERGFRVTKTFLEFERWFARKAKIKPNAMAVFNQTVAVKDIERLNDFIREHMLERRNWSEKVNRLLGHFTQLSEAHQSLIRVRQQFELLEPVARVGTDYQQQAEQFEQAERQMSAIDAFFAQRTVDLFTPKRQQLREELAATSARKESLADEIKAAQDDLYGIQNEIESAGGDRLKLIPSLIVTQRAHVDNKRNASQRYRDALSGAGVVDAVHDETTFASMQARLAELGNELRDSISEADGKRLEVGVKKHQIRKDLDANRLEWDGLNRRRENLPEWCVSLREMVCDNLGLSHKELPFAAELVAVDPVQRDWEASIEKVLRSFALSLLVPERFYQQVSGFVDRTKLAAQGKGQRLVYLHVGEQIPSFNGPAPSPNSLLRKLSFKQGHRLLPWISAELNRRFDYKCCDTIEEFRRCGGLAMTCNRHVKSGNQRHEKDDRSFFVDPRHFVLGWDNREKKRLIAAEIERFEGQEQDIDRLATSLDRTLTKLRNRQAAITSAATVSAFFEIDVEQHEQEIAELEKEKRGIEERSDAIRILKRRLVDVETRRDALQQRRDEAVAKEGKLEDYIAQANRLIDNGNLELRRHKAAGTLAQHQKCFVDLNEKFVDAPLTTDNFQERKDAFRAEQQEFVTHLRRIIDPIRERLLEAMSKFLRTFPEESDLLVKVDYIESFLGLRQRITEDDLPRHERRFKERLNERVIQEIGLFRGDLEREGREIEDKIELLNQSLHKLEYRPGMHIQLESRRVRDPEIVEFQRKLRECIEGSFEDSPEGNEARFLRIQELVERLQDENSRRWRRKVTDVRNWFDFAAAVIDRHTLNTVSVYEDSSGQSGGEKAKLAYTILVAAIAYQYDLDPEHPVGDRFHFVVVDEMFSKVGEQNAEYALELFKQFGLQLLIVAPLDAGARVTQPYVGCYLHVNRRGERSEIFEMTAREFDKTVDATGNGNAAVLHDS